MKIKLLMLFILILGALSCTEKVEQQQQENLTDKPVMIESVNVCDYCVKRFERKELLRIKDDINICADCMVLTFDLMLGRQND